MNCPKIEICVFYFNPNGKVKDGYTRKTLGCKYWHKDFCFREKVLGQCQMRISNILTRGGYDWKDSNTLPKIMESVAWSFDRFNRDMPIKEWRKLTTE